MFVRARQKLLCLSLLLILILDVDYQLFQLIVPDFVVELLEGVYIGEVIEHDDNCVLFADKMVYVCVVLLDAHLQQAEVHLQIFRVVLRALAVYELLVC